MINERLFRNAENAKELWSGIGSFGEVLGEVECCGQTMTNKTDEYTISCTYQNDQNGVYTRKDVFENTSDKEISLNNLKSRFIFPGNEFEVYTQYNCWQGESMGAWQDLNTCISANGSSVRNSQFATPMMAVWSKQHNRGAVFHIIPFCVWEMRALRFNWAGKYGKTMVEMGLAEHNFDLKLAPGEKLEMPEIICYEIKNKTDFDCWKLHNYFNTNYPRKPIPVLYNTWMARFDKITFENVNSQIQPAADMGVEYFVIDAGWFGKEGLESWGAASGDWVENKTSALCGRMIEIADNVRAAGMKFGIWLEPETSGKEADIVIAHPEYYIQNHNGRDFLDFANPDAMKWITERVCSVIEQYGIEYVKFDFNSELFIDIYKTSFIKYFDGYRKFINTIKERFPNIYITNCASGGARVNLASLMCCDSFWPSDNHSIYEQMRVYREGILRMPPQVLEKWAAVESIQNFTPTYSGEPTEKLISSNDELWFDISGVHMDYLKGFFAGSPIAISCDLNMLSEHARNEISEFILEFKENRNFWQNAVCRILSDTDSLATFQYSDTELSEIKIYLFANKLYQFSCVVYPVVDTDKTYIYNDEKISGTKLAEEGIEIETKDWYQCYKISLKEA